jgi:four helix bundle protein
MLYKDLVVWQKAHALTLKTIKAVEGVKRSYAGEVAVKQLLRAVTSTGANIAEGYGRHEGKEYTRFLEIAYGSACEVDNWLTVMRDAGLVKQVVASELMRDNEEILRMLAAMVRRMREKGVRKRG